MTMMAPSTSLSYGTWAAMKTLTSLTLKINGGLPCRSCRLTGRADGPFTRQAVAAGSKKLRSSNCFASRLRSKRHELQHGQIVLRKSAVWVRDVGAKPRGLSLVSGGSSAEPRILFDATPILGDDQMVSWWSESYVSSFGPGEPHSLLLTQAALVMFDTRLVQC
ncbi:hypothetical protein BDU57DRAFT_273260 [Ampelomyces quisqualis]|uniref:Uncharacterized protein n=1 Tax=Ampelomyces quisqualis TaxID=50730 RepID=A0A6A5QN29_AMPQU|nr:hypothetical protein BDU57DRAFT_273260 [Ampelomyces quisqualis]